MQIRKALRQDYLSIARIHKECLPESFLGSLGLSFLTLLYKSLFKHRGGIILVLEENGAVLGFISGTVNSNSFYSYFLRNNCLRLIFLLFLKLFNLNILGKIFEDLVYARKKWVGSIPEAELLSIAVRPGYQRMGAGGRLFKSLVDEFYKRSINEFKILIGENLPGAQEFYQKMGCMEASGIKLHNGRESKIYVFRRR